MCPARALRRRRVEDSQAVVERKPARRLAEGDRGRARGRRQARILSRRLRHAAARGNRRGAWAEPGQHRLLERLGRDPRPAWRRPICRRATRRSSPSTVSWSTRSTSRRPGATPVSVKETDERADVDAILAAVTPKTKIVFLANPNNPTGTYLPFEEVPPPARRPARQRAAGARRGLCRICPAQRLRGRRRAGRRRRRMSS